LYLVAWRIFEEVGVGTQGFNDIALNDISGLYFGQRNTFGTCSQIRTSIYQKLQDIKISIGRVRIDDILYLPISTASLLEGTIPDSFNEIIHLFILQCSSQRRIIRC
jgi:hypothetical protein